MCFSVSCFAVFNGSKPTLSCISLTKGLTGRDIRKYRDSSATWSSSFVSRSSECVSEYI